MGKSCAGPCPEAQKSPAIFIIHNVFLVWWIAKLCIWHLRPEGEGWGAWEGRVCQLAQESAYTCDSRMGDRKKHRLASPERNSPSKRQSFSVWQNTLPSAPAGFSPGVGKLKGLGDGSYPAWLGGTPVGAWGEAPRSWRHVVKTRCSAIAERPRCRVRYSFRQK